MPKHFHITTQRYDRYLSQNVVEKWKIKRQNTDRLMDGIYGYEHVI